MPAFYLTLIAVLLAGIGARDQVTIAGLASRQGQRPGVLLIALLSAAATASLAGYGAHLMLHELPPPARAIFAAIALGMAGIESMALTPRRKPAEPTNSLGALLIVLLAQQVTDAARFLVFGLGVGMAAPVMAGVAGGVGGGSLVALAWARPDVLDNPAYGWVRRVVGAVMCLSAAVIALQEFRLF